LNFSNNPTFWVLYAFCWEWTEAGQSWFGDSYSVRAALSNPLQSTFGFLPVHAEYSVDMIWLHNTSHLVVCTFAEGVTTPGGGGGGTDPLGVPCWPGVLGGFMLNKGYTPSPLLWLNRTFLRSSLSSHSWQSTCTPTNLIEYPTSSSASGRYRYNKLTVSLFTLYGRKHKGVNCTWDHNQS
jgi:hypothetical protein